MNKNRTTEHEVIAKNVTPYPPPQKKKKKKQKKPTLLQLSRGVFL